MIDMTTTLTIENEKEKLIDAMVWRSGFRWWQFIQKRKSLRDAEIAASNIRFLSEMKEKPRV